jgi:hypothetical protein
VLLPAVGIIAILLVALGVRQLSDRAPEVGASITADGSVSIAGLKLTYPADWHAYVLQGSGGSFVNRAVISNLPLTECFVRDEVVDADCLASLQLDAGTVHVTLGNGGVPGFDFAQLEPSAGWDLYVDGQPAVTDEQGPTANGADQTITWRIANPEASDNFYMISAVLREPGITRLRADLDAMIRNATFNNE